MKLSKEAQEKVQELQLLEQNLQNFLSQKQTFQGQLMETESALEELEKSTTAYQIIGNIMVASNKSELTKKLAEKKETLELRIKTIEKQEEKIKRRRLAQCR